PSLHDALPSYIVALGAECEGLYAAVLAHQHQHARLDGLKLSRFEISDDLLERGNAIAPAFALELDNLRAAHSRVASNARNSAQWASTLIPTTIKVNAITCVSPGHSMQSALS